MIRVAITVEGRTEERFVTDVLAPHLLTKKVVAYPILIGRARGRQQGGGNVSVDRLASEMAALYWSFDSVTSLVDFYGFRRHKGIDIGRLEANILGKVSRRLKKEINQSRIIPYIQKFEFEALLFSNVTVFSRIIDGISSDGLKLLERVRSEFPTPEDIDDGPQTAPSKRIMNVLQTYRKRRFGPLIAREIGLPKIRTECSRFDTWITRLESL